MANDDEAVHTHADGVGDTTSVLVDVRRFVTDVQPEVERLVGTTADAAGAFGDERVDAPARQGVEGMDPQPRAVLGAIAHAVRHDGQIPFSSSTWCSSR